MSVIVNLYLYCCICQACLHSLFPSLSLYHSLYLTVSIILYLLLSIILHLSTSLAFSDCLFPPLTVS